METEVDCKCLKIIGHLENLRQCWPQQYKPSPGPLSLGDWISSPYIWLHYVESSDGILPADDVLVSTNTRYWSIHDAQRYFFGDLHCEQVLFTYQYPNLRMPTRLGSYFWKANTALKLPPALYLKEFHMSLEITLKKMEANQSQMDRLIISDQLIKIDRLDYFKRKTFFRILLNILSFQDRLQLVSFENLCCKRLEGVRLIQQLACFNADTLKYLFLWRFVLPNENPLLINYSYLTDEEKAKIAKLLQGIEVPDVKLTERCSAVIKEFHQKFNEDDKEDGEIEEPTELYENPYKVDPNLLDENERKLQALLADCKRAKRDIMSKCGTVSGADPRRPWRTHSNKEKLLRINNELQRHEERANDMMTPLTNREMKELVKECEEESQSAPAITTERLRNTIEEAIKNLPNFKYNKIENSTATDISPDAHVVAVEHI